MFEKLNNKKKNKMNKGDWKMKQQWLKNETMRQITRRLTAIEKWNIEMNNEANYIKKKEAIWSPMFMWHHLPILKKKHSKIWLTEKEKLRQFLPQTRTVNIRAEIH